MLVLISGGGSACAEVPAPGLGVEHLAGITEALLASGAPIEEINIVRRSLSILKGGGLAAAAAPARVVTLILSDVVGNHLPTIAGGPTVPNPTGPAEALAVIEHRRLAGAADPAVLAHLRKGSSMATPPAGPIVVVADAATAAEGARAAAARLGIPAAVVDTRVTGEARLAGRHLADLARGPGPLMSILAGETTVAVTGSGSGGRNQEVALAAAIALDGCDGSVVASLGTDGVDGPTRAAGGVADGSTLARGRTAGLDAVAALDANDSGSYLAVVGSRLVSGPTGTNVGDVMVAWRR
jgi:hydroxypyruvate reductase